MTKIEAELIKIPYFKFEVSAWDAEPDRIELSKDTDISILIKSIENGENLFNLIPNFERKILHNFNLKEAMFEQLETVLYGEKRFPYENGYQQVGKIFVPEDLVISKDSILKRLKVKDLNLSDRFDYNHILSTNPESTLFYGLGANIKPLDHNKYYILKSNQL